ncbi:MAG: succinate dehydrogenase assembly factor 2 [Acidiferrobacterales bacterium]
MNESEELRRLRWRCRRGLLELDVMLQAFVDRAYISLAPSERVAFQRLLSEPDLVLLEYINGIQPVADEELRCIVRKIRQYPDF